MADFSPSDAAFEGFRITREHPAVIPVWAVLQFVVSICLLWAMISSGYLGKLGDMQAAGGQPDFAMLGPAAMQFMKRFVLVLPLVTLVSAVTQAAIMRMVLRPSQQSIGFLRLGGDELRVIGAQLLVGVIVGGFSFAGLVIITAVIGAGGVFGALASLPLMMAYIAGLILLMVRLSLAVPTTFVRGKIDIRGAWELTRGRFWPIFGAYMLAFVLYLIVFIAGGVVGMALGSVLGGAKPPAEASSFSDYMTIGQIAGELIGAVIAAMGAAILFAPAAVIYRAISGDSEAQVF